MMVAPEDRNSCHWGRGEGRKQTPGRGLARENHLVLRTHLALNADLSHFCPTAGRCRGREHIALAALVWRTSIKLLLSSYLRTGATTFEVARPRSVMESGFYSLVCQDFIPNSGKGSSERKCYQIEKKMDNRQKEKGGSCNACSSSKFASLPVH